MPINQLSPLELCMWQARLVDHQLDLLCKQFMLFMTHHPWLAPSILNFLAILYVFACNLDGIIEAYQGNRKW